MENNREPLQQPQQGSGSAENKGGQRKDQLNRSADLSEEDKMNIANEMGVGPNQVSTAKDLGALSGRDDSSGGSGDRMEESNTGEGTER